MTAKRSSIFEADELDVSGFEPQANAKLKDPGERKALQAVAEQRGFASRDPALQVEQPPAPVRTQRRHTTGRNRQINIKASAATIERFYALADANGWVLGETFERAIDALRAQLDGGQEQGAAPRRK